MPNTAQPSAAREDYLKAIHHLASGEKLVPTAEIAAHLGISKPSVSGMVKRLAEEGLVEYAPRRGVRLTAEGQRHSLLVVRRHRLLETFLVEVLGLDWSEVHQEAEILEHHLSDRIVEAIDFRLGFPTEDPHGRPIPDADGNLAGRDLVPLSELRGGENARVAEMRSETPERLQRWKQLGLVPGASLRVERRQDLEDVLHLRIGGATVHTGSEGVEGIYVERVS
jgi:DtxR family Mn-dependent transcriptional regulator